VTRDTVLALDVLRRHISRATAGLSPPSPAPGHSRAYPLRTCVLTPEKRAGSRASPHARPGKCYSADQREG